MKLNRKKVTFTAAKKAKFLRLGQAARTASTHSILAALPADPRSERGSRAEREPDTALGLSISSNPAQPLWKGVWNYNQLYSANLNLFPQI